MSGASNIFQAAIDSSIETFRSLAPLGDELARATEATANCLAAGGKLLVCGNGGSAADAAHLATEFVVRFVKDRPTRRSASRTMPEP